MLGFFHFIHVLLNDLEWILFAISLLVILVGYALWRLHKALFLSFVPTILIVLGVAGVLAFGVLAHKVGTFVYYGLTAQKQIDDLNDKLAGANNTITGLNQEATRKAEQGNAVASTDAQAAVIYRNKYNTIRQVVREPDLSLANRMANDLTSNFYATEDTANAQATH